MKIFGTGRLEINSDDAESIVIIDIKSGEIIVQPQNNEILNNRYPNIFNEEISISSFEATIRDGKLTTDRFPELFVKNYNQNHNILESIPLRAFKFLDNYVGNEIKLKPKNSKIEFNFQPANGRNEFTEFHFINVNIPTIFEIEFNGVNCNASLDKSGHAILSLDETLQEEEKGQLSDIFRIACCLGQGGYSSVREIITPENFTLNLAGYDITKPPFKLVSQDDFKQLLGSVIDSYTEFEEEDISLLKNAIYYLEGGYKQAVHLEFRVISLFTSIEILDKSRTLDKSIIKNQFNLPSLYDAALLNEIRNQLIHNGSSLQKAISVAKANNRENDKDDSELLKLFKENKEQEQIVIYYFLLDLVTAYLHEKFRYSGKFQTNLARL